MKDFMGTEIHVGDLVVTMDSRFHKLFTGTVFGVHDNMVTVQLMTESGKVYSVERRYPKAIMVIQ